MWLKGFPWKFAFRRLARAHRLTDPIVLLSHFRRFAQPSEGMVPIELLREEPANGTLVRWVGRWRQKPPQIEVRVPDCEAATVAGDSDELRVRRLRHREDEPPDKGCAG